MFQMNKMVFWQWNPCGIWLEVWVVCCNSSTYQINWKITLRLQTRMLQMNELNCVSTIKSSCTLPLAKKKKDCVRVYVIVCESVRQSITWGISFVLQTRQTRQTRRTRLNRLPDIRSGQVRSKKVRWGHMRSDKVRCSQVKLHEVRWGSMSSDEVTWG